MIINAKSIPVQTEATGTVFLQHFTDFQSKIFNTQQAWFPNTQFLELSIKTSIRNANSLHNESRMCYMVSYESSSPLGQGTKDEL